MADGGEEKAYKLTVIEDEGLKEEIFKAYNNKDAAAKEYAAKLEQTKERKYSAGFTGTARVEYPNGDTYEGGFHNGHKHGQGKYAYANGDTYEGEYAHNHKEGVGKLTIQGQGYYFGYFKGGKKHGEGLFQYKNKDRYSGNWKNGKKHGTGTYIVDASKVKLVGTWFEGEITEGKWILANGDTFEGQFEHNKPKGVGVWTLKNGTSVKGEYSHEFLENDGKADDLHPIDPATKLKIKLDWNTRYMLPTA